MSHGEHTTFPVEARGAGSSDDPGGLHVDRSRSTPDPDNHHRHAPE